MNEVLAITGIAGKSGQAFAGHLSENAQMIKEMFPGGIKLLMHTKREHDNEILSEFSPKLLYGELEDGNFLADCFEDVDTIVHIAGIHWSREVVTAAGNANVKRMIMVHTTGIYSKYKAAGEEYRHIDEYVASICKSKNIMLTILRPTMIYGTLSDGNVVKFIKMVDKLPVMPVVNKAEYELQPVHYSDLGKAYFDVLVAPEVTGGHDYVLSGGEEIMLRDMFIEMGKHLSKKMHFVSVPFTVAYFGAWCVYVLSLRRFDFREKVQRLCEPRVYSHEEATKDFGYNPKTFRSMIGDEVSQYIQSKA